MTQTNSVGLCTSEIALEWLLTESLREFSWSLIELSSFSVKNKGKVSFQKIPFLLSFFLMIINCLWKQLLKNKFCNPLLYSKLVFNKYLLFDWLNRDGSKLKNWLHIFTATSRFFKPLIFRPFFPSRPRPHEIFFFSPYLVLCIIHVSLISYSLFLLLVSHTYLIFPPMSSSPQMLG